MRLVPLLLAASVCAACPPALDDDDDDDDDVGGEGEGEGEGALDAGQADAGGADAGEGGEGEGEEIPICDGGICDDAGVAGQEYDGAPEDGVVCGAGTCAGAEAMCCVTADFEGIDGKCVADAVECEGGLIQATFLCDGPEDCADGEECCLHENITTTCVALGACQGDPDTTDSVVCLDTAGCQVGELCCGLDVEFPVPVDMGTCTNEDDNCQAQ